MINGANMLVNIDEYIINALKEDITSEDITTNAIMPESKRGIAELICKQDGVLCGIDVFRRTFEILDNTAEFRTNFKDGDKLKKVKL